ncbi:MAG: hypothetical protein ACM3KD_05700 [Hyphomicrobiaceae bacterium]
MAHSTPSYPGYGSPCNGCGQCCLNQPCAVARQFRLWKNGACRALSFRAGRYWCDVIVKPGRVSTTLRKLPLDVRLDCIGVVGRCDAKKRTDSP